MIAMCNHEKLKIFDQSGIPAGTCCITKEPLNDWHIEFGPFEMPDTGKGKIIKIGHYKEGADNVSR